MSPYLSDCMPDERVAIQPPSVEWVKLSGKCPTVQPRALSCSSSARAERARLRPARSASPRRSRGRGPCRAHVDGDDRAVLVGRRLEAAGDVRAAAERDDDRVGVDDRAHDRHERPSSPPGRTTTSGRRPRSPRAVAHEVAQALAAGVDDAVERVGRDVRRGRRPPRGRRAGRRAASARGRRARRSRPGARRRRRRVDVDLALEERPELGLVLVRERRPPRRPSPTTSSGPCHVLHVGSTPRRRRRPPTL